MTYPKVIPSKEGDTSFAPRPAKPTAALTLSVTATHVYFYLFWVSSELCMTLETPWLTDVYLLDNRQLYEAILGWSRDRKTKLVTMV